MNLVLGSGSPRRKSILEDLFGEIRIILPSVDESRYKNENADDYTERITNLKMDAVISGFDCAGDFCIVTSDTIVSIDGNILGKPESEDEAFAMLELLSGKEHHVITGICLVVINGGKSERFYSCEKTSVKFKMLSETVIKGYLERVNYRDKAGSYAIQESGNMLVQSYSGSLTNIIGFPLRLFFRMLNNTGRLEDI